MLRLFTRESEQGDSGWFDLADVVSSLHLPQLSWTAEDIFVNVSRDPGLDVAELEQLSSAPHLPSPVLDNSSFMRLTETTQQFIDGEFVGFNPSEVGDIDRAVIRLDMSDGSLWTIIIDTDRVEILDGFARAFGPGTRVPAMTTRTTGPSTEMPP
ncbi:hypothetical protein EDF42_1449 [Curtobacterium sp. PhB172]|uniref:hypothetical protein n=1 Tax=Curtobacterium sp. PhB172 TaxID=2485196 RepID=UPI000F4D0EE5|nr:hypothetical protein [Curtobacterium sp. PhB172]ROS67417.1 hypothetical protein EDF42_1449 [Curtobacterium sp. PhB172]